MTKNTNKDYLLSNRLYDILNWVALTVLPAIGTLYFALATIWGLPAAEAVLGSLAAFSAFIGTLIKVSNKSYNQSDAKYDGSMDIWRDEVSGTKHHSLNLYSDPDELSNSESITFKVNS